MKNIPEGYEIIPDGYEVVEDDPATSLSEDFKLGLTGAINAIDSWGTGVIRAPLLGDKEYEELKWRKRGREQWANPEGKKQKFGGKVVSAVTTLPAQVLAMPFSPAETGQTMLDQGETLPRSIAGTGADTVGNMIGVALPGSKGLTIPGKIGSGVAINAGQDAVTRSVIAGIAEHEATKDLLGPSWENAAVAGVTGGMVGALHSKRGGPEKTQIKIPEGYEEVPQRTDKGIFVEDVPEGIRKQQEFYNKEEYVKPETEVDYSKQVEFPFDTGVETIAAHQPRGLQRDMFVELDKAQREFDPYKETQQKQLFEQSLDDSRLTEEATKKAEIDKAYEQRRQQLADEMKEEIRLNKEDMLSQLEERMTRNLGRGMAKRQRGAIDVGPDFLEKVKTRFSKFDVEVEPGAINPDSVMIRLKTPDGKLAGFVDFAKREDGVLVAENAQVADALRGKGAAQRMYLAAREAGYDIAPGRVQTDLGNKMVEKLQKNGLINKEPLGQRFSAGNLNLKPLEGESLPGYGLNRGMGRGQRGAIDFEGITEGLRSLLPNIRQHGDVPAINKIVGNNLIPKDPKAGDILAKALAEGKDTDAWNATKYTASGSTLEAMTRKSALLDGVSKLVQNAQKRADLYIQKTVFPVEKMFRSMNINEIKQLSEVFRAEAFGRGTFTVEQLQGMGMSEKQLRAYAGMRKLFENTLEIQNQARVAKGLKPIDGSEFYMASRWEGDFRQPVRDAEGRLVFYLAADTKMGLNKQKKALLKEMPELVIDEKQAHRTHSKGSKSDLQTMYTTMLDVLGRDDPAVAKIREAYENAMATEATTTLGQLKHAKRKAGIRGFVGDRPGTNAKKESLAMFQEQINYSKNAYKWAALQEASIPLKEILANEDLVKQQPKNVEYAQEYFKNALGQGEAKWVSAIEEAFRETGISPNVVNNGISNAKSFFITQKLAASTGYTIANLLQTINVTPHLIDTLVKMGGNPVKAFATGVPLGMAMASGHYINKLGGDFTKYLPHDLKFYEDAFRYAEDNGVTSRSIYDEAPITNRGPVSGALSLAGKTMTIPETGVRSMAYMTFVQMLKDTKKFKTDGEIFQRAEELTNAAMVDYRAAERPMGFAKLGVAGNALNTLQTYPVNLYNQYRYFGKEAARGNWLPLVAMIAIQYAMAGAMGMPGFSDLDKLWGWTKEKLPDEQWAKVRDFDPKLWMIENLGEASVYGALSTNTGVSMTSRVSAPGATDMIQAPGGPALDLAKQVGSMGQAIVNPTSTNVAQAVRNSAPTGLQGAVETKMFPNEFSVQRQDGNRVWKKASNLAAREGQYVRTPEEEKLRTMGLRSQREALSNDVTYKVNALEKQVDERSKSLIDKYYDAIRRGDMKKVSSIQKLYTEINGHPIWDESIESDILKEYTTVMERKSASTAQKLQAIKGMARMKKIMEQHDNK